MRTAGLVALAALCIVTLYGILHGIWVLADGSPHSNPAVVAVSVAVLVIIFAAALAGFRSVYASRMKRP
jgi:hypothetical protein